MFLAQQTPQTMLTKLARALWDLLRLLLHLPVLFRDTIRLLLRNATRMDYIIEFLDASKSDTTTYYILGLPFPAYFTRDPAVVQALLNDNFDNFEKGEPFRARLRELLGTGIFNADGNQWRFQRKIASHIFSSRNLRDCMSTSFSKHGVELLERIERVSAACAKGGGIGAKGAYFDMQDMFYRFTFDSIGEIAFGVSVGCLTKEEVPFARAFDIVQEYLQERFVNPALRCIQDFLEITKQIVFPAVTPSMA